MFAACSRAIFVGELVELDLVHASALIVSMRNELHAACRNELANPRARQRVALGGPCVLPIAGGPHVFVPRDGT